MTKIAGLPVSGYRPQSQAALDTVNAAKEMEEHVLRLLDEFAEDATLEPDRRWLALGRSHIEQGFMAVNRSVFKPQRVAIAEEDDAIVETGWVLERADSDVAAPLYYAPKDPHGDCWSSDPDVALRFAREIDAASLAAVLGFSVRVCAHEWG